MSDFLASLIDRAANREPVLERRRPSLFEPAIPRRGETDATHPGSSREPREQNAGLEREAATEIGATGPRTPLPIRRPLRPAPPSKGEDEAANIESTEPDVHVVRASSSRRAPLQKREHAEEAVEPGPSREDPILSAEISRTIRASPQNETPRDVRKPPPGRKDLEIPERAAPDSALASPRPMREPVHPDALDSTVTPASPLAPGPRNATAPAAVPLRMAPPRSNELSALARRPRSAPQVNSMRMPPVPQGPPPIHITIGRIEVRANPAPGTPSRARQPAAPRLNLEDYLLSRNGGSR